MRLWKIAAFALLVVCIGHLIFIFYEAEPAKPELYEDKPIRKLMLEADYFPILCDALIIIIIVTGLLRGVRRKSKPRIPEEEVDWWKLMLMRAGALALVGLIYVVVLRKGLTNRGFIKVLEGFQGLGDPAGAPEFVLAEPTPFEQFIVILLSLIIITVIAILLVTFLRPSQKEENPLLVAFPEFILGKKREFTFDGDPRDVVINAYGATLETLYKKGFHIPEHSTPWEFQQQVGDPHLSRLTQLFERARYSTHPISPRDSEEAVKKYRLIRETEFDIPVLPDEE